MKRYGFDIKAPVANKSYAVMDSNFKKLFYNCTYLESREPKGKILNKYFEGHDGHSCSLQDALWWVPQHLVDKIVMESRDVLSEIINGND